jgi:hypothetical protein
MTMPRLSGRDRIADLEDRRRKLDADLERARFTLRDSYAAILRELPIEALSERELRDLLREALRAGGSASVAALKALPRPT